MVELKKRIRKKLGFYYRFAKTYVKNRQVFNQILDLSEKPLIYYSVLRKSPIPERDILKAVQDGDVIIVRNIIGQLGLQRQFNQLIRDFFKLDYTELDQIHKKRTIEQIVDDALAVRHSVPTLILQSSIMKRLLEPHIKSVFLELLPNLRLHLPYGKVKAHEQYIESRMGRGKINPHGQHKDSWRYHPKNTINVWVALSEANESNGLSILPQSADYQPKFDAVIQEIAQGVKTYPSQQWVTDMKAGDAAIFEAELLHGSIINTTDKTRACLSMRCAPSEPEFHKRVTYNYIKIENGQFDNLTRGKLGASGDFEPSCRDSIFASAEQHNSSIEPLSFDEHSIKLKVGERVESFPRYCPHAGTDLLNGELDENGKLICPSHRMCLKGKPCNG